MADLQARIDRVANLSIDSLARSIQRIGFECTDCGACCRADDETSPHTATIYPDEVRAIQHERDRSWNEVARPIPYGLADDGTGETFEWALRTSPCGDCHFYRGDDATGGGCSIYADRPGICRTYPFSLDLDDTEPLGGTPVDTDGLVTAHSCEGLGRAIDAERAQELARELRDRTLRDLRERRAVLSSYRESDPAAETIVYDSEGAKHPDGTPIGPET